MPGAEEPAEQAEEAAEKEEEGKGKKKRTAADKTDAAGQKSPAKKAKGESTGTSSLLHKQDKVAYILVNYLRDACVVCYSCCSSSVDLV